MKVKAEFLTMTTAATYNNKKKKRKNKIKENFFLPLTFEQYEK